ncbi:MAG: FAD-dependent oxidoreductase [Deltaproteobacteria bacterium]|nr:FAD-dependent oxidoreductase [Deltaproteobacteria bacterium]
MAQTFDLIVAGGGPAGLEAARTAARFGLRVALIERKSHPTLLMRSCAQMFLMNMDSFYNEAMYPAPQQQRWVFPVNNFSVPYRGSYREFYACHFVAPNASDRIEIGDYERNACGAGVPAYVFDKAALLQGLFDECVSAGVVFYTGRNVVCASHDSGGVTLRTAEGDRMAGRYCIAADGVNSRLAQITGLNRQRRFINTARAVSYYIEGVRFERSEAIVLGMGWQRSQNRPLPFCLLPSVYGPEEYWLYVAGEQDFQYLIRRSAFRQWFGDVRVLRMRANVVNNWSPAPEPYAGGIIFAGDSCWFAEAENTGALMSGHRAAAAVCAAAHRGLAGRNALQDYLAWWRHNWPQAHDYREFVCYPLFNRLFTEEEYVYLHALVGRPLTWSLNPFKLYDRLMEGLRPHMARMERERPGLARKISRFRPDMALQLIAPAARSGFPNR